MLDGLSGTGLVEGRDFAKTIRECPGRHGHGERPDRRRGRRGADLLITFSTPTLQAALQRAKRMPIVFNYVADPDRRRRRHERHGARRRT